MGMRFGAFAACVGVPALLVALTPSQQLTGRSASSKIQTQAEYDISELLGRDTPAYHADTDADGVWVNNTAQLMTASFSGGGVTLHRGEHSVHLALDFLGRSEDLRPVGVAAPVAKENRVEYPRGAVTEWYVNGPFGLQQGFTLDHSPGPEEDGMLTLELSLHGLEAMVDAGGRGLTLMTSEGVDVLRYSGLLAYDATGRDLTARLDVIGARLRLSVDDTNAHYPVVIDPWVRSATLTASDGQSGDQLGASVAISGDTIVAGANGANIGANLDQGAVYLFEKPTSGWASATEAAKLTASDGKANNDFGGSVAISGDVVVVGAKDARIGFESHGAVYVFVKPLTGWASATENAKLTHLGAASLDRFGQSVSISGDTIVVGADGKDIGGWSNRGAGYVFVKPGTGWANATENAVLLPSAGGGNSSFGSSVSIDGDTIVVGALAASFGGISQRGAAYVFEKPISGWENEIEEIALLSVATAGTNDFLGGAVSIHQETVTAGAILSDAGGNQDQGAVYVFEKPASGWASGTETAVLSVSNGQPGDHFGDSVSIRGDILVAGARDGPGAYVFHEPISGWASGTETGTIDGQFVAIDGEVIVSGAPTASFGGNSNQGQTLVLEKVTDVPLLAAISPAILTNFSAGVQNVTLTGEDLHSVTQLTVGGQVQPIVTQSRTSLTIAIPNGFVIASHPVVAVNAVGSSNQLTLTVQGAHPGALVTAPLQATGTTQSYSTYTDAGWYSLYVLSAQQGATVLPGIVSFEIGGGLFSNLVGFIPVVADSGGFADLSVTMPTTLSPPFTLYWQCLTYDPAVPLEQQLPLETSNSAAVLTFS